MGWFGKNNYEKHAEKLDKKLGKILEEMEIPELKDLCKNLIGSTPRNKLKLYDKKGNVVHEFEEPISRKDYYTFYAHYQENLDEVNDMMLSKYLIKRRILDRHDPDYEYLRTHDKDDNEIDESTLEKIEKEEGPKVETTNLLKDSIILKLEREFNPEKVYDEKELQNLLRSFLQQAFPDITVENRTQLRNLSAQLEEYQEEYANLIALIMNNDELGLSDDISHYVKKYKSKLGVESVVKIGKKRG